MVLMSREVTELLRKVLELSVTDRAELAGSLIETLDRIKEKSVEDAWEAEIVRRMEDLESERVKPISDGEDPRRLVSAIE
jgi:putative addiction module component (TIGR02574 family)